LQSAHEAELWAQLKGDGSIEARNELMRRYWPLVKKLAEVLKAKLPDCVEVDDLASDGVFGLAQAIDRFEPARGFKFATYAIPRIRGAMRDALRDQDWVPRLVRSRKQKAPEVHSINGTVFETEIGKPVTAAMLIADDSPTPADVLEQRDMRHVILKALPSRSHRLLVKLYQLEGHTLKEAGKVLGFSESRASQMHAEAMGILQSAALEGGRLQELVNAGDEDDDP
jgi:RNA polymerase sigma factor for flagellar operon FliA